MVKIGLFEAKQKLSELVVRASSGEQIGITRRGKLEAVIGPAQPTINLKQVFSEIAEIRKRAKPLKGLTAKDLIEEGRR